MSGEEVLARIAEDDVDLVLLDIQMPGLDGMTAVKRWPEGGPPIAFCTAHAEHVLAAFDAGAIDYLLKPVESARLRKALDRARAQGTRARVLDEAARHRAEPAPLLQCNNRSPASRCRRARGILLVDPNDVTHGLLDGDLVTVYPTAGGAFFCDLSQNELADRLPADHFERAPPGAPEPGARGAPPARRDGRVRGAHGGRSRGGGVAPGGADLHLQRKVGSR